MGGRKKRARRLTLMCGLPQDVLGAGARVTLHDQSSVMIEGQRGVLELATTRIRLRTGRGVLSVLGEGLILHEMSADAAMIMGERIDTVTYGRTEVR